VKGGPSSGFDPPVTIRLLGEDKEDSCIGYNQDTNKDTWKCLSEKDVIILKGL